MRIFSMLYTYFVSFTKKYSGRISHYFKNFNLTYFSILFVVNLLLLGERLVSIYAECY